jgi:hypothetical protein
VIGVTSDRDCQAVRLHRRRRSYARIVEHLGYPDRRAAHRDALRVPFAAPAAEEALLRPLRAWETDERLLNVQRRFQ